MSLIIPGLDKTENTVLQLLAEIHQRHLSVLNGRRYFVVK